MLIIISIAHECVRGAASLLNAYNTVLSVHISTRVDTHVLMYWLAATKGASRSRRLMVIITSYRRIITPIYMLACILCTCQDAHTTACMLHDLLSLTYLALRKLAEALSGMKCVCNAPNACTHVL